MHSVAVGCMFDGNNHRPPITCCSGRWLNTTDTFPFRHCSIFVPSEWSVFTLSVVFSHLPE